MRATSQRNGRVVGEAVVMGQLANDGRPCAGFRGVPREAEGYLRLIASKPSPFKRANDAATG